MKSSSLTLPLHAAARTVSTLFVATAVCAAMVTATHADDQYPNRPISIIVPWAAGGGSDAVARIFGTALQKHLGTTVNIVNRTGGGSIVGHTALAHSKPDGYTLGLMTGELNLMHWQGLTPVTYKDFAPLAQINYDPGGVQVSASSPYQNLGDLLDAIKSSEPGTFKASGVGVGGIWHTLFAGLLADQGIDPKAVRWIPSEGAAPAMVDLAAGTLDIVPTSVPEARAMMESGRVKSLAIMATELNPAFPDVPTVTDAIGSNYNQGQWRGIGAPKGLPAEVTAKLALALKSAFEDPIYQDFMKTQGFGMQWRSAEEFGAYLEQTDAQMGKVIEALGLKK